MKIEHPPYGYCDVCGQPLTDLICDCGEVYD